MKRPGLSVTALGRQRKQPVAVTFRAAPVFGSMRKFLVLSVLPLAACLSPPETPETSEADQSIFDSVSGFEAPSTTVAWTATGMPTTTTVALAAASAPDPLWQYPKTTLRAFYRNASNHNLYGFSNVDGQTGWTADGNFPVSGTVFSSAPTAISWSTTRYDVFWIEGGFIGSSGVVWHAYASGSSWTTESLGTTSTPPIGDPVAASWADGHIDLFWRDQNNGLRRKEFDRAKRGASGFTSGGWQVGDSLVVSSFPANPFTVAEPTTNEIDVAYRSTGGTLEIAKTPNDSSFTLFDTEIPIDGVPAAGSWGANSLFVIAKSGSSVKQMVRNSTGILFDTTTLPSDHTFTNPIAAATPSRANRVDFLAIGSGSSVIHSFYQESLPGWSDLSNPRTDWWCWADSGGAVVNYLKHQSLHTCQYVTTAFGINCCSTPYQSACLDSGNPRNVLSEYGYDHDETDKLSFEALRYYLQVLHQPVIAHQDNHGSSVNHVVVLHDVYTIAGVNYVEIMDPAQGGVTWVYPYSEYLAYDGSWNVDAMYYDFTPE